MIENSPERDFADTQVIHEPGQITEPGDLRVSGKYVSKHLNRDGTVATMAVIEVVGMDEERGSFTSRPVGYNFRFTNSMGDMGIKPYQDGRWNARNWLAPAS